MGESEAFEPAAAAPAWSPDSASIAYVLWQQRLTDSGPTEFNATARVIDIGHKRDRRLFEGSGWHPEAVWSPDGRWLALPTDRDRRRGTSCFSPPCDVVAELYLVSRDGRLTRRLTNNRADDFAPSWSPDGSRVAFISGRDRPQGKRIWRDVYVTSTAGGKVVRITKDAAWESALTWPRPDRLEVTRVDGSRFAVSLEAPGEPHCQVAFSRKGNALLRLDPGQWLGSARAIATGKRATSTRVWKRVIRTPRSISALRMDGECA